MKMYHLIVVLPDGKFGVTNYPSETQRDEAIAREEMRCLAPREEKDLETLTTIELFDLHNFLAIRPISVMKEKTAMMSRVWRLLEGIQPEDERPPEQPQNQESDVAKTSAKKTKVPKANKINGERKTREGSKTEIIKNLLSRKSGCTRKDILDATGWKAVSVQQLAKATGLKLRQEKKEGSAVTTYYGE